MAEYVVIRAARRMPGRRTEILEARLAVPTLPVVGDALHRPFGLLTQEARFVVRSRSFEQPSAGGDWYCVAWVGPNG
jgi:hypothetical protein